MTQKEISVFMGRQKQLVDNFVKDLGGVDADSRFARGKEYCAGCNDFVPRDMFVTQYGLCEAHYQDMLQDQEQKWGEAKNVEI